MLIPEDTEVHPRAEILSFAIYYAHSRIRETIDVLEGRSVLLPLVDAHGISLRGTIQSYLHQMPVLHAHSDGPIGRQLS